MARPVNVEIAKLKVEMKKVQYTILSEKVADLQEKLNVALQKMKDKEVEINELVVSVAS